MLCPACGHENPDGSRYCGECGASLSVPTECPSCGAPVAADQKFCNACGRRVEEETPGAAPTPPDLKADVPSHLAEKIRTAKPAIEGERKQVTVLFADVMGSMDLAGAVDPEDWRAIMERFFAILCEGVHRFEGTVDKFTGDGIMALFGAPIAHEDHAARACYAALHLKEELARYAADLRRERGLSFSVRIGINSGEVVVGTIGEDLSLDYTAIGHTVGLAQRMESLAEPGNAYLTQHTAALVEGYFALKDLGEFDVKGARGPLGVYELEGLGALRTRLDVSRARGFSRFVGRDEETARLEAALEHAIAGDVQVVGIVAEAGVGKSRLCYEFAQRCRVRGLEVWEAHGLAHAKAVPFVPVLEILRNYFGIDERDDERLAREKVAGRLLLLDATFSEKLPLIFEFLGIPDPERPVPRMDAEARQRQLFGALDQLLRARSEQAPGVILLEDLHWIDPASEAFLQNLVETAPGTRTLVLTNFRPEYHADWMQKSYYQQLALAPLGPEAIEELLGDLLGADPSLNGLPELVRERTSGNPFFIEEVVQSLVEGGSLQGTRGSYRLVQTIEEVAIPATVQSVLAARIDRLAERYKSVLQTASVIGREFSEPVLRRVAEIPEGELATALRELVSAEFLYEQALYPEAEYAFKHPLTEEVAFRSQLAARRGRVHLAVAATLTELYPEKHNEQAALIAHHWEAGGDLLQAAQWSARAAAWAGFNDPSEAMRHWRKVRELTSGLPASAETYQLGIGSRIQLLQLTWRLGVTDEAENAQIFAEGETLAQDSDDSASLALLLVSYANVLGTAGRIPEYVEAALEGLRLAEELGDPNLQMVIRPAPCYALFLVGRLQESLQIASRGIELCESDPMLGAGIAVASPYAWCMYWRGYIHGILGDLHAAERDLDQGVALARQYGDSETRGWAHMMYVNLGAYTGDREAPLAHALQALELAERIGDSFSRVWAYTFVGIAHAMREEWDDAIAQLEHAIEFSQQMHTGIEGHAWREAYLADAYLGRGDSTQALETAREAVEFARAGGLRLAHSFAELALARVLRSVEGASAREEIEAALDQGLTTAREIGARGNEALAHLEWAELARTVEDDELRLRELEQARSIFEQIGATARAAELESELAAAR